MDIITSPNIVELVKPSVFLAGGITNCPDWQKDFIDNFTNSFSIREVTIVNPRCEEWDDTRDNIEVSKEQISWEKNYLDVTTGVVFWFPKETLCPITLFELGGALYSRNIIAIGIDPEYQRKLDIEVQVGLVNKNIPIVYSVNDLVDETMEYFKNYKSFEDYDNEISKKYEEYRENTLTREEVDDIVTKIQMEQYSKLTPTEIINESKKMIIQCAGIDGSHHKDWCLDQTFRILSGEKYLQNIHEACVVDGEEVYDWDVGIAP